VDLPSGYSPRGFRVASAGKRYLGFDLPIVITAPELLKKFQEMPEKADAIEVDVKDMAYVSSAGLRVLLMMYKSLIDKSQFKLLNVSDEVKEILETTGFDQFLL